MIRRTVQFSRDAANVFLHLLTACNLSCRHCYINPEQHGNRTLSPETACRWIEVLAAGRRSPNLVLLGGEPTLHPDLAEIVRAARHLGYGSVTVDTNGYLFHDFLERVTPGEVDFISFSLDGADAGTNDAIRGKGAYDICTDGVRRAVTAGFHTSLIFTVSQMNLADLERMPDLLAQLGVERFFIQVIGIRGRWARRDADDLQVDRGAWLTRIPAVAEAAAARGITTTYPKVFLAPGETFECAGRVADNYFIFPNGRVYRCPLCEDYPLHAMRIDDAGLSPMPPVNENDLFGLDIPEGCVMNKLVQPGNLTYRPDGTPDYRIACCLLKEEISA